MTISIEPVDTDRPTLAGRVSGVNIATGVSADEVSQIEDAIDQFGVLIFHNQQHTDEQQFAFSKLFGPMEKATGDIAKSEERRLSLDLNDISNLDQNGKLLPRDDRRRLFGLGNMLWHSDSSFKPTPAKFSLLSARVIPETGGNTEFADMRAAWDALDSTMQKRCMDLVCEHSQIYSRSLLGFSDWDESERLKNAPVRQRLVRRHPRTGRLSLFLAAHAGVIEGWPIPEARMFLRDLTEHATQRKFVYAHKWQQHDLVMWDNRVLMHRAREYDPDKVRDMRRTTVSDSAPTLEQAR